MGFASKDLSIGRLSKRTGCNVETIRYYEKIGLLSAPPRTPGGHRVYGDDDARRLAFICRGRGLGFSLDEVRALLALADGQEYNCGKVREITLHHLREVKAKIRDLRRLERTLAAISRECEGGVAPRCPIIEALYGAQA
jgi:MerR family mercuric resistance operon transcriptional regulator